MEWDNSVHAPVHTQAKGSKSRNDDDDDGGGGDDEGDDDDDDDDDNDGCTNEGKTGCASE